MPDNLGALAEGVVEAVVKGGEAVAGEPQYARAVRGDLGKRDGKQAGNISAGSGGIFLVVWSRNAAVTCHTLVHTGEGLVKPGAHKSLVVMRLPLSARDEGRRGDGSIECKGRGRRR